MADSNGNQNQRRTLWIMAAAGIFLLVVIGAAVIFSSPAVQKQKENSEISTTEYSDANDGWSEVGLEAVGVTKADEILSDGSLVSDVTVSPFEADALKTDDTYSFNLDELKTFDSSAIVSSSDNVLSDSVFASDSDTSKSNSSSDSVDLSKITTSNVSATNEFTAAQIESAKEAVKNNVDSVSTTVKETVKPKAATTKKTTASKTTKSSTSGVPSIWIQVGSFEDVNKANNSRSLLEENGYRNVSVLTRSADSKTMYRVRVGPYSNKSDAEAAAAKISKMKQFAECYVVDSNAPAVH